MVGRIQRGGTPPSVSPELARVSCILTLFQSRCPNGHQSCSLGHRQGCVQHPENLARVATNGLLSFSALTSCP